MSFIDCVAARQLSLTRADQALMALIEADPIRASLGSASDLACRAKVHGATVGRLARKLGFADWRALQAALRDEHIQRSGALPGEPPATGAQDAGAQDAGAQDAGAPLGSPADGSPLLGGTRLAGLQDGLQAQRTREAAPEGTPSMLSKVASGMVAQIEATARLGRAPMLEAAARRLCEARVVWVAARGDLAGVGLLLIARLRRATLDARGLAEHGLDGLADALPEDVLLEVAGWLPENRCEGLGRCAAARGLAVVLVGPLTGSDDLAPDVHLEVPAGRGGDGVLTGQLLGAVALASTVLTLRPGAVWS